MTAGLCPRRALEGVKLTLTRLWHDGLVTSATDPMPGRAATAR